MTCHDVGKESDHQRKRLGDNTKQLDGLHDRYRKLQEYRHIRPEYLLPIMLVSKQVYGKEREHCKHQGHCNVSSNIRSAREERHQSEQVAKEDEEERRKQVRGIFPIFLLAYRRLDDLVIDHHDHHLHKACKASWSRLCRIMSSIPSCRSEYDQNQKHACYHQRSDILRYRNVKRSDKLSVSSSLHYLVFIASFFRYEKSFVFMSMFKLR